MIEADGSTFSCHDLSCTVSVHGFSSFRLNNWQDHARQSPAVFVSSHEGTKRVLGTCASPQNRRMQELRQSRGTLYTPCEITVAVIFNSQASRDLRFHKWCRIRTILSWGASPGLSGKTFARDEHCSRCGKPVLIRYRENKMCPSTETILCPWCGHNWTLEIPGRLLWVEKR